MDNVLIISDDGQSVIGCDKKFSGEILIPEHITDIASEAFMDCSMSKVKMPNSLKHIGRSAFSHCTNLKEVVLNDGIEEIGPYAFSRCTLLSDINLPSSLKQIGHPYQGGVFLNCISLKSIVIPEGIEEINYYTFEGCSNLLSVSLPSTLRRIGNGKYSDGRIFSGCVSLQKVIISDIASWCSFNKLSKLSNPLAYAHHLYSQDNTEIEHVEIPDSVDVIEAGTFQGCTGIKSLVIQNKNWVEVKENAFKGCVGLRELTLYNKNVNAVLNELKDCDNVEIVNIKHYSPNLIIGLQGFKELKKVFSLDNDDNKIEIDVNAVIQAKADELKLMSMFYHNMGMNLTQVYGKYPNKTSFKEIVYICEDGMDKDDMISCIRSKQQESQLLLNEDWLNASGLGLALGWNDYRAIDFDYVHYSEMDETIHQCLQMLGLPDNYPWVVRSGSMNGFHIIIRVKEFMDKDAAPLAFAYLASEKQRIELRWKGHLVLPPSVHNSGGKYAFYREQIPSTKPQYVELGKIDELLDYYCGEDWGKSYKWNDRSFILIERRKNNSEDSQGVCFSKRVKDDHQCSIHWLKACDNSQSRIALAIKYILGKDLPTNRQKAYDLLKEANDNLAYINLASLISVGFFPGTRQDVITLLDKVDHKKLLWRVWVELLEHGYGEYELSSSIIDNIRSQSVKYLPEGKSESYLFFDTETTGTPINYNAPSSDTKNWPRLVQLAWILTDKEGNKIHSNNIIVKPLGYSIPMNSVKIHGITTQKAMEVGLSLDEVIKQFETDFASATYIVGHNVEFDKRIVGAEMIRLGKNDIMDSKKSFCTMKSSINLCKIPGYNGYKYPKLQELYKKLFAKEFENAHDAMSDIEATKECFWELKKLKLI